MRTRQALLRAALLATCVAALPLAAGAAKQAAVTQQSHIYLHGPNGQLTTGLRCGTPGPTPEEVSAVARVLDSAELQEPVSDRITVPIAFHILYKVDDAGEIVGIPPEGQIEDQVAVLNDAFSGFQFHLASVDYFEQTEEAPWFDECYKYNAQMKRALAISPETTLNLYTCTPYIGQSLLLGYATFPWSYPEDSSLHGVVVLYASLPGGGAYPYDEGDTATHEIGHYLGLWHTFESGCTVPGDEVRDTPYEATPAFGCPVGRDSCRQRGEDPVFNFMDYSEDTCMNHFTGGQDERMERVVPVYRPSLVDNTAP